MLELNIYITIYLDYKIIYSKLNAYVIVSKLISFLIKCLLYLVIPFNSRFN